MFPLDEKKLSLAGMFQKQIKKAFPLPENLFPLTGTPLDGKIKLAVAGVSQTRRKKWFPPENQFLQAGMLFFKNWTFRFPQTEKESLNKYCFN